MSLVMEDDYSKSIAKTQLDEFRYTDGCFGPGNVCLSSKLEKIDFSNQIQSYLDQNLDSFEAGDEVHVESFVRITVDVVEIRAEIVVEPPPHGDRG